MSELVRLTALPRPFSMARQILEVPPGLSLEEMFALAQPNQMLRGYASIFIGDERIAPEYWPAVRPKPGTEVTIRVLPAGGDGDKDALSILLTIVVIVASIFLPILLPATAFTVAGVAVSYGAIAAAGVGLLAGLAQTALASPPRQPRANNISGLPQSSPTQSITGTRNRASLFGVEPRVFGRTRIFPLFAALPFSEWNGDVQYFTTLFEVGYGPLELSDFRIGETPLAQYQDVEIEIREGRATDEPLTLYRNQVREDAFSVTITQAGGALIRETQVNADEFSLDLAWPRGLIWLPSDQAGINASGPQAPLSVDVKIEYRTAGSADPWTAAPNLINTVEYDTTAVTETSAPAGKKYVDYKTDNLIKGVVCAGLTCPATLTTSSGTATLHGIKYRVYSRFEGSTEWKLQIDMEDYLEAGNSQTVELIGTQATKMEVRIERKAVAYNDTDTEPAANGGGYNAIPAPASWTYQGQSITDGTFTFTAEQHELLRRTILVRPAAQGKFEIRITRITLDIVKEGQDEFELAAIRTVTWVLAPECHRPRADRAAHPRHRPAARHAR